MELIVVLLCLVLVIVIAKCSNKKKPTKKKKATAWDEVKFFVDVNKEMRRDYTLIIDKSGSMGFSSSGFFSFSGPTLWDEARDAVTHLAPFITKFDPDGITLYFFDSKYTKHENITSAQHVKSLFSRVLPGGSTNLATVMQAAFKEHFKQHKDETILVVTDGKPDSESLVKDAIIQATQKLTRPEELSISFIQIGSDSGAAEFLEALDDDLEGQGAKFDIVDTLTKDEMNGMSFSQLVQKSLLD